MKKCVICIVLLLIATQTTGLFADINSFTDDITEANDGSVNSDASKETTESSRAKKKQRVNSSSNSSSTSCGDACGEIFFNVLAGVWAVNNFSVSFAPYPYAYDDTYIQSAISVNNAAYSDSFNPSRYSIATSAVYLQGIGFGNETIFEGYLYRFFGPLFENTIYYDGKDMTGNVSLGGQIALCQTNPISFSLFMQWSHWYGTVGKVLPTNGCSFGIHLRSYPFSPLVLEWRVGEQVFGDSSTNFFNSDLSMGYMIGRIELFASWKHLAIIHDRTGEIISKYDGVTVGTKIYF